MPALVSKLRNSNLKVFKTNNAAGGEHAEVMSQSTFSDEDILNYWGSWPHSFSNLSTRIRRSAISRVVDSTRRSTAFSSAAPRALKPARNSAVVTANPAMAAHFKIDLRKKR